MKSLSPLNVRFALPGYWHAVDGRLRIYVPAVKRARHRALFVEMLLGSMDGVLQVKANPTTGNVLVRFEPDALAHDDIVVALYKADCLRLDAPPTATPDAQPLAAVMRDALVRSLAESLVRRALSSLF